MLKLASIILVALMSIVWFLPLVILINKICNCKGDKKSLQKQVVVFLLQTNFNPIFVSMIFSTNKIYDILISTLWSIRFDFGYDGIV